MPERVYTDEERAAGLSQEQQAVQPSVPSVRERIREAPHRMFESAEATVDTGRKAAREAYRTHREDPVAKASIAQFANRTRENKENFDKGKISRALYEQREKRNLEHFNRVSRPVEERVATKVEKVANRAISGQYNISGTVRNVHDEIVGRGVGNQAPFISRRASVRTSPRPPARRAAPYRGVGFAASGRPDFGIGQGALDFRRGSTLNFGSLPPFHMGTAVNVQALEEFGSHKHYGLPGITPDFRSPLFGKR